MTPITRTCRLCGKKDSPHPARADDPTKPRDRCRACLRTYLRAWRQAHWQKVKLRDTWRGMIDRCSHPSRLRRYANAPHLPSPRHYIDQGIKVCARWRHPTRGLAAFAEDMGPPPSRAHTLDRKRNTRGYSPSNCRWATPAEQHANRKNARLVTATDPTRTDPTTTPTTSTPARQLTLTLSAWGRLTGVDRRTIAARLDRGWTPDDAVAPTLTFAPF